MCGTRGAAANRTPTGRRGVAAAGIEVREAREHVGLALLHREAANDPQPSRLTVAPIGAGVIL